MASNLKKFLILLGVLFLAGVLLLGALIAVVIYGDDKAKTKATALCASAAVGSPAEAMVARAKASGTGTREPHWIKAEEGGDEMLVSFPAWLPLTGYTCRITARDGKVTGSEVYAVD